MTSPNSSHRGAPYLVAPRRGRRRRTWLERQRSSRRGRFELALLGGGVIALILAGVLPGLDFTSALLLLMLGGFCMTVVASYTGLIPALAAAAFAPLVIALTDPMWTLGASLADFTLGGESFATFGTFVAAALFGAFIKRWRNEQRTRKTTGLWRAKRRTD